MEGCAPQLAALLGERLHTDILTDRHTHCPGPKYTRSCPLKYFSKQPDTLHTKTMFVGTVHAHIHRYTNTGTQSLQKANYVMAKRHMLKPECPRYCFVAMWLWACYLTSLGLSFLIGKRDGNRSEVIGL